MCNRYIEIYRQNLQQYVKDGELSDDQVQALERLQVMLCIPKQTVEKIHEEICGTLFEKVIHILLIISFIYTVYVLSASFDVC